MFERRAKLSAGQQVCGTLDIILPSQDRAAVVGYGPTGNIVARLLRENGIEPVIIELRMSYLHELGQGI